MLLCDVGNTTLHFYDGTASYRVPVEEFDPEQVSEAVGYISVNRLFSTRLEGCERWENLEAYIDRSRYYDTMGIDRIVACEALEDGVIVDAGSAVTVDVMRHGLFEGGFIYPGIAAMQRCYEGISPALAYSFNFELDLAKMPKNSQDAVSYGYLRTLVCEIQRHGGPVVVTGGDAARFAPLLPEARVDEYLIFRGMKRILENRC